VSATYSGFSLISPLPAGVTAPSPEGLRRGLVNGQPSVWMDWGSGVLPALTTGVQALVPTVVGAQYVLRASIATGSRPIFGAARKWALRANGIGGTILALSQSNERNTFAPLYFTATKTFTLIEVVLAESGSGAEVGLYNMSLRQLNYEHPFKLRATVFESSLDNHFDLACNSYAASWHVDKSGITKFVPSVTAIPVSHVFADEQGEQFLEYVDIEASYDTSSIVNEVEVTNKGVGGDGNADDATVIWQDLDSIGKYGIRRETLTTNLNVWKKREKSPERLVQALTAKRVNPRVSVSSLVWNAQQDIAAANRLEVGQRAVVRYRGSEYDLQIVALEHDMTPDRWLIKVYFNLP